MGLNFSARLATAILSRMINKRYQDYKKGVAIFNAQTRVARRMVTCIEASFCTDGQRERPGLRGAAEGHAATTMASLYPPALLALPLHVQHRLPPALQSVDLEVTLIVHSVRAGAVGEKKGGTDARRTHSCSRFWPRPSPYTPAMRYHSRSSASLPPPRRSCRRSSRTFSSSGSSPSPSTSSGSSIARTRHGCS